MQATKFVESYIDAWNHEDPKGVADHLTSDGIYLDITENLQRSHDELLVSLKDFFANYPHRYELLGDILNNDNTIAFQYRMYPVGQDGKRLLPVSYDGAEFISLLGDSAVSITDYYDTPASMQVNKYAKSGLSDNQLQVHKQSLDHIMRSQQAYLRPDLTLPKVAKIVGCSVNHLSQVINAGFGTSFFDYLNSYRIEHAMDLLSSLDSKSTAILNIAFTVGFNSNSAFYSAFKKRVGITPAQYRQKQVQQTL